MRISHHHVEENVLYLGHLRNSVWMQLAHNNIHEYNFYSLSRYSNVNVVIAAQPLEDYLIVKLEIGPIFVHNICTLTDIFQYFQRLTFPFLYVPLFYFPCLVSSFQNGSKLTQEGQKCTESQLKVSMLQESPPWSPCIRRKRTVWSGKAARM